MNTIRNIEGATLLAIGALCAAAVTSIVLHSARLAPAGQDSVAATSVVQLPTVVIVGKHLSRAEKSSLLDRHVAG